ncbi:MAG: helix-turn-helix domain-containing protein, partial [Phaeodactylibacter sp.]|nr:helix-turn-helix domain-containing protein [Phaeodactylibacter sp.]
LKEGFRIDDQSYLGWFARATLSFWPKWDFKSGHRFYKKAMALNPSFTEAEEGLAELYTGIGDFEKAMAHTRNILTLNPLSPNHYYTKGVIHYLSRDYLQALESMEAALKVDPNFGFAIEMSLACYILLKDYEKLDSFLGEHPQAERPEECRALYKLMYPDENIDIGLSAIPSRLREGADSTLFPWHLFLQVYLGHHELALDILEEGVNRRMGPMINFMNIPFLEPLHRYERFQRLVKNTFHADKLPDEGSVDTVDAPAGRALLEEEVVQQYLATLSHHFENEQLFLDQNLSLKTLAAQMDIHPNKLSWLLNEHIGKNFNELVNSYRLEAFKGKALDPANSHLTLLALAFDSGFNSKSVFNDFFKKKEGMTPRAWVKANTRQV